LAKDKLQKQQLKKVRQRHQVAALPYRIVEGRAELCLVTTRTTKRWSLPKGWPMKGRKDFEAAAIEAKEEAGLRGKVGKRAIGTYRYFKRQKDHFELVRVNVYPLKVEKELKAWPEHKQRKVNWWSLAQAVVLADEPGVAGVLLQFAAKLGGKSEKKALASLLEGRFDKGASQQEADTHQHANRS